MKIIDKVFIYKGNFTPNFALFKSKHDSRLCLYHPSKYLLHPSPPPVKGSHKNGQVWTLISRYMSVYVSSLSREVPIQTLLDALCEIIGNELCPSGCYHSCCCPIFGQSLCLLKLVLSEYLSVTQPVEPVSA